MRLSKAPRLGNGLRNVFAVDTLQNAVRQSDSSVARSLPVLSTRTGTTRASGATLLLKAGSRRNTWRRYLITRSMFAKWKRLSCRSEARMTRACGW